MIKAPCVSGGLYVTRGAVAGLARYGERAVMLPLMSLRVAETERLMHSGSSPLAATGLPRATADDSFNCFQSFRLVLAQWRRVLLCVCVMVLYCACVCADAVCSHCLWMLYTCGACLINAFVHSEKMRVKNS